MQRRQFMIQPPTQKSNTDDHGGFYPHQHLFKICRHLFVDQIAPRYGDTRQSVGRHGIKITDHRLWHNPRAQRQCGPTIGGHTDRRDRVRNQKLIYGRVTATDHCNWRRR